MKILCEVTQEREETDDEGKPIYFTSKFYLLHWGLEYRIIEIAEDQIAAVNYSIAICEDYETGDVLIFLPSQIKILGKQFNTENR